MQRKIRKAFLRPALPYDRSYKFEAHEESSLELREETIDNQHLKQEMLETNFENADLLGKNRVQ